MELKIAVENNVAIAELISDQIEINSVQDGLDLMAIADQLGARSLIVYENNLAPEFFDLKTKIAGEILQKYANYHFKLAIVGEFKKYQSHTLYAFAAECNRGNHIFFVADRQTALKIIVHTSV